MKKMTSPPIVSSMLGLSIATILAVMIGSCSKKDIQPTESPIEVSANKPPPPPPTPANPAIIFNADTTFTYRGQQHGVQAIFVMDADGSHRKMIHHDFVTSGNSWSLGNVTNPKWSGNGQQACFAGRVFMSSGPPIRPLSSFSSIFTMNVSLINGVPTASNVTKILDGEVNSTSYVYPAWSPTANEIVMKAGQSGLPDRLQIIPATGGTAVTIYTSPSVDLFIHSPCFSPDGSKIAFHLRNGSVEKSIQVIDRFTGSVLNSVTLDPAYGWSELDWSRTEGSSTLCFRKTIPNTGAQGFLCTLNFNISSTPTELTPNAAYPTWSPNDSQIAYSESTNLQGIIKVFTLSTNTNTTISTVGGYSLNWKR